MSKKALVFETNIREAMANVGLFYDEKSVDENIHSIFVSSLVFITFIIDLEQSLEIEIPEQYLSLDNLGSLRQMDSILISLLKERQRKLGWKGRIFRAFQRICKK